MVDKKKIALMTKLATNDKYYTKKDLRITSHYREDYVYLNNFKTRISVLAVVGGLVALHILLKIEKGINIPNNLKDILSEYVFPYGIFAVGVLALYTVFSTAVYRKKYALAQKRVNQYQKTLKALDEYENKKSIIEEEKDDSARTNVIY